MKSKLILAGVAAAVAALLVVAAVGGYNYRSYEMRRDAVAAKIKKQATADRLHANNPYYDGSPDFVDRAPIMLLVGTWDLKRDSVKLTELLLTTANTDEEKISAAQKLAAAKTNLAAFEKELEKTYDAGLPKALTEKN